MSKRRIIQSKLNFTSSKRTKTSEDLPHLDKSENSNSDSQNDNDTTLKTSPTKPLSSWKLPDIANGDVYYIPHFIKVEQANDWYNELVSVCEWYHPKLKVYGKEVNQSRSIAAYAQDKSLVVKYSGHVVQMQYDYPSVLSEVQTKVEEQVGVKFNHVMLNRYESGNEYIGKHRDTKENKVIASLSLGAVRTFILTPDKSNTVGKAQKWTLANGSLLVMSGATQDNWKHEIPKEPKIHDGRISLTFRQLST